MPGFPSPACVPAQPQSRASSSAASTTSHLARGTPHCGKPHDGVHIPMLREAEQARVRAVGEMGALGLRPGPSSPKLGRVTYPELNGGHNHIYVRLNRGRHWVQAWQHGRPGPKTHHHRESHFVVKFNHYTSL